MDNEAFSAIRMAEMSHVPAQRLAESLTETVFSFDGPVKVVIDWTIRNFSSLKTQTTFLLSDRTIVGASAWSIRLDPLDATGKQNSVPDATSVYV